MDLRNLENLLGVKSDNRVQDQKKVILPIEKWQHVNECVDMERTTRLIQASRYGAQECVDLLLRCGADVNARDIYKKRAIDYSTAGSHLEVTLTLLRWDSLLPSVTKERFKALIDQNEDIRQFFINRDNMHRMLIDVKPESLEKIVSNTEDACKAPRCWVNSDGESALYTAAKRWKCDAWALLRASGFAYATKEEKEYAETCETDDAFLCAIGRYFVELGGCHVQKMVARSKVYKVEGVDEERCGEKVKGYFKDVDGEECTSDLLKCLQDDPSLEVIFDFTSTDIQCMHPLGKNCKVFGLADLELNRIYVAAMETTEFDYSDVVSNLVHELAHKALAIVFENGGLPYRTGDIEVQEEYKNIMKKVLSNEYNVFFDKIIRRALKAGDLIGQELIVRVPEMIAKHKDEGDRSEDTEDGFSRLQRQVPELLEFYMTRVLPKIRSYIERNKTANKVVKSELLRNTELLTSYYDKKIQVCESIKDVQTYRHGLLDVLKVSNLKLGVSHLQMSMKEVTFVDWTKYQSMSDYFRLSVSRNEIERLAIVWDRSKRPQFCRSTRCNDCECIARKLQTVAHRSVLIVPKNISVLQKVKCIDYSWNDLSSDTKRWILGKRLKFGGMGMKLKEVIGSISGDEAVESKMAELLNADELSMIISQENIEIGSPMRSTTKDRWFELLNNHTELFIPRSLRLRHLELNKLFFERRENDAFIIRNSQESNLEGFTKDKVCGWDGKNIPDGIRCFILGKEWNHGDEDDYFRGIIEKFNVSQLSEAGRIKWHFVHFFTLIDENYFHNFSLNFTQDSGNCAGKFEYPGLDVLEYGDFNRNRVVVIADGPGSGKSVFVKEAAHEMKMKYTKCWIEFVELPLFETQLKNWQENELQSNGNAIDFIHDIIKMGDSSFEKTLFNIFCQVENKCIIFFDGFDEVCPNFKEKFISLLEVLIRSTKVKVCVTTRVHESADLENRLSTLAYDFIPLNRKQQVKLLSMEWNASLKSLHPNERTNKIEKIILCLQSHYDSICENELFDLGNLKSLSDPNVVFKDVNFLALAEELMNVGKSMVDGDVDFSETPLHAWMLASVAFEENFNVRESMSLSQLYKRFLDLKIELYSRDKAKAIAYAAGDSKEVLFKTSTYELLKKFSAFFFLHDEDYELKTNELPHLLRIGVVVQRSGSTMFVHRTFGEYLFSLWLLDVAKKKKMTKVMLGQVLLEEEFQKVRKFINNLLISIYEEKSSYGAEGREWEKTILSCSAFPSRKEFVKSIQKCLYVSIVECHIGILQYLAESAGDCFTEVILDGADLVIEALNLNISSLCKTNEWNALTFCGECIEHGVRLKVSTSKPLNVDYLNYLSNLLRLLEKHSTTASLHQVILREGLWWLGVNNVHLWCKEEGRMYFQFLFSFLVKNLDTFADVLKSKIFSKDGNKLFVNAFKFSAEPFLSFLNLILEEKDFTNLILEEENFLSAWIGVVEECGLGTVQWVWGYLGEKLRTRENKGKFLCRKGVGNRNALFASCLNQGNPDIFVFVWETYQKEMDGEECKEALFDSFSKVKQYSGFITHVFLKWLRQLLREEFLNGDEATRLLLSVDESGRYHHLLNYDIYNSPLELYALQDLLLTGSLGSRIILEHRNCHYMKLARSCFMNSEWLGVDEDFESGVKKEFLLMLPAMELNPLVGQIKFDNEGYLLHALNKYKQRIEGIRLKSFLVLLKRQLGIEEGILGGRELAERLKEIWVEVYMFFPCFLVEQFNGNGLLVNTGDQLPLPMVERDRRTRAFLVPYFFATLSGVLSREQVTQVLLHKVLLYTTAFHMAPNWSDRRAFHALYDVARWSMGEDALWRVHSAGGELEGTSVLDFLLNKQDGGLFEESKYVHSTLTLSV